MMAVFAPIKDRYQAAWQRWVQRRSPIAKRVELNQRRVFIFPTGYGFFFLLTSFLLFVGGVNYESSLILNLSFFLISLFLVAILHTFKNLAGLVLVAEGTKPAFKGQDALFQIGMERTSKRNHESLTISWEGRQSELVDVVDVIHQNIEISLSTHKRGWFQPQRFKIQSTFPLGLLRTWSWVQLDLTALVYPMPIQCEYVGTDNQGATEGNKKVPTGQDDFDYLRQYQLGESLKNIAWKKYANSQKLLSKVFHGIASDTFWLRWSGVPASDVELRLSMLCYWVVTYSKENREFGLSLPTIDIPPAAGKDHELACLRALALYGSDKTGVDA